VIRRARDSASAEQLLGLWRDRWAIENRLFRVKDAVMREDHSRIRSGQAARAMSVIRNAIIGYFRTYDTPCVAERLRANVLLTTNSSINSVFSFSESPCTNNRPRWSADSQNRIVGQRHL
jgi:hypothetical protein